MITPAFHFKILENFVEIFAEKSKIFVKVLQKEIGSKSFDIHPYVSKCTLDIICGKFYISSHNYVQSYILTIFIQLSRNILYLNNI